MMVLCFSPTPTELTNQLPSDMEPSQRLKALQTHVLLLQTSCQIQKVEQTQMTNKLVDLRGRGAPSSGEGSAAPGILVVGQ